MGSSPSSKKKDPFPGSASFETGQRSKRHSCLSEGCLSSEAGFARLAGTVTVIGWHFSDEHSHALLDSLMLRHCEVIHSLLSDFLTDSDDQPRARPIYCNFRSGVFHDKCPMSTRMIPFEERYPRHPGYAQGTITPSLSVCPIWTSHGIASFSRQSQPQSKEMVRIVVVGGGAVGKSSLVRVLTNPDKGWGDGYDPTIEDDYQMDLEMGNGHRVMIDILDTAGKEEFSALTDEWYLSADVLMVCASLDSPMTMEDQFRDYLIRVERSRDVSLEGRRTDRMKVSRSQSAAIVLVGTKCDLPVRSTRRASEMARVSPLSVDYDVPYVETSAKYAINVERAFQTAVYEHWLTHMYFAKHS